VTVWEGAGSGGDNGQSGTAGFISGLYKAVPPMSDLFNMAGMELPAYLGKARADEPQAEADTEKPKT
jgi:flotillin